MPKRRWFGSNRSEIWQQLADGISATYVPGGFARGDKVVATHGEWTLTLDTYVVPAGNAPIVFTRLRAPYVNPDGFRFHIYRRSVFTELGKLLGMQDIEIGVEPFDHDFVIKSNDEDRVRSLLADAKLRQLLERQPGISLEVKDSEGWFGPTFPDDADELLFTVVGVITDLSVLEALFELFSYTLDRLCDIGSAYAEAPDVTLR